MKFDLTFQPRFNCAICSTRCDGRSKSAFIFTDDVALSVQAEDWILQHFQEVLGLSVYKAAGEIHGLPDLEIIRGQKIIARVEVKAQSRAFMSIERLLPKSNLHPYEAVALNLSDLKRYITLYQREDIPLFLVWRVQRPCLGEGYWGHSVTRLQEIYQHYQGDRRYRRRSTLSDYVDGQHCGVTVNYHFSLRELLPLSAVEHCLQQL
ncbi:hypothetical protein [Candidatus Chloroploca sp. Khr17]|uniref:hypothetical protein n=1 Tax=Candidatus Chloroploca sp. Khr17 TaxID=2496869 RepID=UPI00101B992C|nr:hypothetical protein [Candidatus Chloroploca sp. Khr17]